MIRPAAARLLAAPLSALLLCATACDRAESERPHDARLGENATSHHRVSVSLHPIASLVQAMLPESIDVVTLLPPGASPHGFELSADRVRMVAESDVLVTVGQSVDPWAMSAARASGSKKLQTVSLLTIVTDQPREPGTGSELHAQPHAHDTSADREEKGAPTHEHDQARKADPAAERDAAQSDHLHAQDNAHPDSSHHDHDHDHDHDYDHGHAHHEHAGDNPHVWLDPVRMRRAVAELASVFQRRYADHAEVIAARARQLDAEFTALDAFAREQLGDLPQRKLVTFHNAFDLLAERYDLEVVAHLTDVTLQPGGEVLPRQLARVSERVREHGLSVIYAEPQFPDQAVRALQRETGVRVLRLDPLGHAADEGTSDYFRMMRENIRQLAKGQRLSRADPAP